MDKAKYYQVANELRKRFTEDHYLSAIEHDILPEFNSVLIFTDRLSENFINAIVDIIDENEMKWKARPVGLGHEFAFKVVLYDNIKP